MQSTCSTSAAKGTDALCGPSPRLPALMPSARGSAKRRQLHPVCASKEVTLLDYGAGNVRSVRNAIRKLGFSIKDVRLPNTGAVYCIQSIYQHR